VFRSRRDRAPFTKAFEGGSHQPDGVHPHDLYASGGEAACRASRGGISFSLGGGASERPFEHLPEEPFS
jgi:hypothetical protein